MHQNMLYSNYDQRSANEATMRFHSMNTKIAGLPRIDNAKCLPSTEDFGRFLHCTANGNRKISQ